MLIFLMKYVFSVFLGQFLRKYGKLDMSFLSIRGYFEQIKTKI
jgi:hypothetical protein